ncbi:MAG: reverse transcriptase domain-containing protein, partial [Stellaceae bacterium]
MTLDGLEKLLIAHFGDKNRRKARRAKVKLVRYADDFIVTGASKEVLEEAKSLIVSFLKERGLSLSEEKTRITHIDDGFDFLGWNFRKYKGKLLIQPAKKNVQAVLRKVRELIKTHRAAKQATVIAKLN